MCDCVCEDGKNVDDIEKLRGDFKSKLKVQVKLNVNKQVHMNVFDVIGISCTPDFCNDCD